MGQGSVVSLHVAPSSLPGRARLRADGLVFAKRLLPIGSAGSGGFGPGLPLGCVVTLAVWCDLAAYEGWSAGALRDHTRGSWTAVLEAHSTRGSFRGRRPIAATGRRAPDEPVGVITLGRASWRTLPRFLWHGARLAAPTRDAPGLITALSAGVPLTGNLTFSLWEAERDMLRFAYGDGDAGHRATARARPPILVEQLNARLRPLRLEGRWDARATLHAPRLQAFATRLSP